VLYLAWAPFFSGAERALLLTLRALDPGRYEPVVIAGTDGEFASQVRALGIECAVAPLLTLDRRHPVDWARSVAAVCQTARTHRVSLVHSNDTPSFQPGGYAARLLGLPVLSHVRFPDTSAGYRWFFRTRLSGAVFVSRYLMQAAIAEAPDVFMNRSTVLYDCVELQPAWSADEHASVRRQLGIGAGAVTVAITGQVAEVKGIWDFVEAARLAAVRVPDLLFVVLGDDLKNGGAMRRAMEARVHDLGLSERFRFLGFRTDAPRIVQSFDVIAVPSLIEPLGNATLEAMAAGRPVAGSRVGGIPEMVVDDVTGLLVPPGSPTALADAFVQLTRDPDRRARMATAARRRAAETFGMQRHGATLQAQYDALLDESRSSRTGRRSA
jgi:glycosyltransferase involved in cell wall biosynthesis